MISDILSMAHQPMPLAGFVPWPKRLVHTAVPKPVAPPGERQRTRAALFDDHMLLTEPERRFRQVDEAAFVFQEERGGGLSLRAPAVLGHGFQAVEPEL